MNGTKLLMPNYKPTLVTPAIATAYLKSALTNRMIRQGKLLRFINDMKEGKWKEGTAEPIKISKDGELIDGQHRMRALIKADVSLNFDVAFNVDKSVMDVLDTGSARSPSDIFRIEKINLSNVIPAIISTYTQLSLGKTTITGNAMIKPSNSELLKLYYERELFWQAAGAKAMSWYNAFAKIIKPSLIGGMYSLFFDFDENDAESFMNQLTTGMDIKKDTISLLRQKLMQDRMNPRKMSGLLKNALIIKTWIYFRNSTEVKQLRFAPEKEPFPIPI